MTTPSTTQPGPFSALVSARTWCAAAYVLTALPVGAVTFSLIFSLLAAGFSLVLVTVGIPIIAGTLVVAGGLARFERGRLRVYLGEVVPRPAEPDRAGAGWLAWLLRTVRSGVRWRAAAYLLVLFPVGTVGFALVPAFWAAGLVGTTLPAWAWLLPPGASSVFGDMTTAKRLVPAVVVGVFTLFLAPWVTLAWADLSAWLARRLLGPSRSDLLSVRVGQLETTRTRVVDASDAERRRIERDLHDGAQQRLVALAVDLGRARVKLEGDPAAPAEVTAMVAAAHDEAKQTLAELRDLVRGIHPAVLSDRGLDAALSALAARCPVPVTVTSSLAEDGGCPPSTEAVAYFVVAEALTNVAKHADATQVQVTARNDGDALVVAVADDGRGGADPAGAGLLGLADRAAALDGSLDVESPAGGPTTITVRLPCA